MNQDARQAAEATDYAAKARELWAFLMDRFPDGVPQNEIYHVVTAALQSAHAAGLAQGNAAGFERGVRAASEAMRLATEALEKLALQPWERCPSTHCERREECGEPNECSGTGRSIARKALAAIDALAKGGA